MVHSGIGGRQVNSYLSALNIPPVSNTLLSQREKEIGPGIESVADVSIKQSLAEELKLSTKYGIVCCFQTFYIATLFCHVYPSACT